MLVVTRELRVIISIIGSDSFYNSSIAPATKVQTRPPARVLVLGIETRVPGRIRVITGNVVILKDTLDRLLKMFTYLHSLGCLYNIHLSCRHSLVLPISNIYIRLHAYHDGRHELCDLDLSPFSWLPHA